MRRTVFIGDVHGCLDELKEMVRGLEIGREDRVILLGDLVNKGPDSEGAVRFVFDRGWESVLGNHDRFWIRNVERTERFGAFRKEIGSKAWDWFSSLPLRIETKDFLAVHAGLEPGTPLEDHAPEVLTGIRNWPRDRRSKEFAATGGRDERTPRDRKSKEFAATGSGDERTPRDRRSKEFAATEDRFPRMPMDAEEARTPKHPWHRFHHEDRPLFYGHWARQGLRRCGRTLGLDSGCVYGKALSAAILETGEVFQVPSKKVYSEIDD